jgi:hypothetical protein
VDRYHAGYLLESSDTRALTGQHGDEKALVKPQRYGSRMDANQGVHLVESERYATLPKKVKQSFEINKRGF